MRKIKYLLIIVSIIAAGNIMRSVFAAGVNFNDSDNPAGQYSSPTLNNVKFTGNTGIGTTTPQTALAVLGNVGVGTWTADSAALVVFGGNLGIGTAVPGGKLEIVGIGSTSASSSLIIRDSSFNNKVTVLNNGNIGLGIASPNSMIQIHGGAGNSLIRFTNVSTGTTAGTFLGQQGSSDFYVMNETASGGLAFGTNNTTIITVNSVGNVGISTATPRAKLSIFGFVNTSGTAPTLSSCGTSPSIVGTDMAFTITGGATASACTATFAVAKSKTPVCVVSPQYSTTTNSYTVSATAVTFSDAALGTNKIDVLCVGRD